MKYRKLRIAFSAACGVLCLLLIALWVRSYWWMEAATMSISTNRIVTMGSFAGTVGVGTRNGKAPLSIVRRPADEQWDLIRQTNFPIPSPLWGGARTLRGGFAISLPHWLLVAMLAAATSAFWLPWRFSLRTMLIATTLVAVGLGVVVWATKN